MTDLRKNDRVRAVSFALDTGLRIWPVDPLAGRWRVVEVTGRRPDEFTELFADGDLLECQAEYPNATFGINDNESVPPGTLGTVDLADGTNTFVVWDNGRRLGLTRDDRVELVDREGGPRAVSLSAVVEHGRIDAEHFISEQVGTPIGEPRVERRTFEAKNHPEGSLERARLNEHVLTSEYMPSYRYAAFKPQEGLSERSCWRSFRTRGEAVYWIEN